MQLPIKLATNFNADQKKHKKHRSLHMIEPGLRPSTPIQSPISKSLLNSKTNSNPRKNNNNSLPTSVKVNSNPSRHYSAPVAIFKSETVPADSTPLLSKTDKKKFVAASAIGNESGSARIQTTTNQACCCILS